MGLDEAKKMAEMEERFREAEAIIGHEPISAFGKVTWESDNVLIISHESVPSR